MAFSRFSDAQHVFEPELLRQIIGTRVEEGGAQLGARCGGGEDARTLRIVELHAVESGGCAPGPICTGKARSP